MKLKYNILALSLFGAIATACDPMDEIYNNLDAQGTVVSKTMEEYVLTEADYASISTAAGKVATTDEEKALAKAVKTDLALNEFATADKFVPSIIANLLPSWGKGSSVGVTYNYQNSPADYVIEYRTATSTSLTNNVYASIWGDGSPIKFLTPAHSPETVIPAFLLEQYAEAADGDLVLVDYKYDSKEPEYSGKEYLKQDFETGITSGDELVIANWKNIDLTSSKKWISKTYSGNSYAEISAYKATTDVDSWLISPAVTIDSESASITFDIVFGHYKGDCFDILVSDSYNGGDEIDPSKWTSLKNMFTFPEPLTSGYTAMTNVGKASLASYKGKTVYFAFQYSGNPTDKTTTVQIDNFSVSSSVLSPTNEKPCSALYKFNGTKWNLNSDASLVVIAPEDYDAMGSETGKYDNFSNTAEPADYLPKFLAQKFPYAQEGESKAVMYKYYDTSKVTSIKVDEYILTSGVWVLNNNIETKTKINFVCGTNGWMFDPTVTKSLVSTDYLILENWVKSNKDAGYMDQKYGNSEYWFGGSSYYQNFNIQLSKRRSNDPDNKIPADDTAAKEYLLSMVVEGIEMILANLYASAPAQMGGVDCYYNITAKIYDGLETIPYMYRFKGKGNGEFVLQGKPTPVN